MSNSIRNRLLSDVDYNNRKKTNQDKLDKAEKAKESS